MATEWGEWLVCYAGYCCPQCGRFRMMRNANGMEVCEKCEWCPQLGMYVDLDRHPPVEYEGLATGKKRDLIARDRILRDPYFREDRYPESHLLRMAIREQPAVDAVEVVRCKACANRGNEDKCPLRHLVWKPDEGYIWADFTMDEDFCSRGERRKYDE